MWFEVVRMKIAQYIIDCLLSSYVDHFKGCHAVLHLTQVVWCHRSCDHYPYKIFHTEAGTITFAVFTCLPALWVMLRLCC